MNRQYGHLSTEFQTAAEMGRRGTPVVTVMDAEVTAWDGTVFYLPEKRRAAVWAYCAGILFWPGDTGGGMTGPLRCFRAAAKHRDGGRTGLQAASAERLPPERREPPPGSSGGRTFRDGPTGPAPSGGAFFPSYESAPPLQVQVSPAPPVRCAGPAAAKGRY